MNFQHAQRQLQDIFTQHHFVEHLSNGKKHAVLLPIEQCANGTVISISFPGYKAHINNGNVKYDYRVDFTKNGKTTSLSHVNIMMDLYNKIVHGNLDAAVVADLLRREVRQNDEHDLQQHLDMLFYQPVVPSSALLQRAERTHQKLSKVYNLAGNTFDLTPEELFRSLKWIALQEDINYPIERGLEGRKMPFARYLETIFVTAQEKYVLEDVIERALAHYRPTLWSELDYTFLHF